MKIDKFVLTIIIFTVAVLFVGVYLSTKSSGAQPIEQNANAKALVEEYSYDWGTIGINDGDVKTRFKIKNEGSEVLKLWNVATSCACTTAQFLMGDIKSPLFGMHTKSDFILEVPSGETTDLEVVFSPDFHGPNGVGPITRQITLQSNDADNPQLSFTAEALVTK